MGSYFPNRWPLSYLNLTKNMKTYIRRQQHKKFFKHQDIKQKEPPQKYRLGTISNTKLLAGLNRFYMAITSPSASAVVHNISERHICNKNDIVYTCINTFSRCLAPRDLHCRITYCICESSFFILVVIIIYLLSLMIH